MLSIQNTVCEIDVIVLRFIKLNLTDDVFTNSVEISKVSDNAEHVLLYQIGCTSVSI